MLSLFPCLATLLKNHFNQFNSLKGTDTILSWYEKGKDITRAFRGWSPTTKSSTERWSAQSFSRASNNLNRLDGWTYMSHKYS